MTINRGMASLGLRMRSAARRGSLGALSALALAAASYAHSAGLAGTWHVAVPAWGIEDHLLVVQEQGGVLTGKFEFADVRGTATDTQFQFDAVEPGGALLLHFQGTVAPGGTLKGTVTSPKDGVLVQHGVAEPLSTEWTARREAHTR